MRSIESRGMVDRSTCAMSISLRRRPLIRISVLAVAKAPKPRKSTEVLAPLTALPNRLVTCTPGTWARMSGRLLEGECAISSAVITVADAPTMPLNCRTPLPPVPPPSPVPVLVPSDVPVPAPRTGATLRAGRGTPPPSSNSGRARVLFGSVGGLTSTGGKSAGGDCACVVALARTRKLDASKSVRCRLAAVRMEDMA